MSAKLKPLQGLLDRLNKHYKKDVKLVWVQRRNKELNASADMGVGIISLVGYSKYFHPEVLAHEYAHFIVRYDMDKRRFAINRVGFDHPPRFFTAYKKVCKVIGIKPQMMSIDAAARFTSKLQAGDINPS